jgi:tRNA nucleotidyltransferase/poly(A) polymerase
MRLYEVGGYVRLRGRVVLGNFFFEDVQSLFEEKGFRIFQSRPEFLTIRARFPDKSLVADFVIGRKEIGYTDGRHPDVVLAGSITDDLARRDFTVNAIARCVESGTLIDPHGGIQDPAIALYNYPIWAINFSRYPDDSEK